MSLHGAAAGGVFGLLYVVWEKLAPEILESDIVERRRIVSLGGFQKMGYTLLILFVLTALFPLVELGLGIRGNCGGLGFGRWLRRRRFQFHKVVQKITVTHGNVFLCGTYLQI